MKKVFSALIIFSFIALFSIPAFAAFSSVTTVNFTDLSGVRRTPEAVYFRLNHNSANMASCTGINVTDSAGTASVQFHAQPFDTNNCDIWSLVNITANFNGTVAQIYWNNDTPVINLSKPLGAMVLFNETCDDGNLFDNSTGYNWSYGAGGNGDTQQCIGGVITATGELGSPLAFQSIVNGGLFWNNVTFSLDVIDEYPVGTVGGAFVHFLSNQTNSPYRRSINVDLYPSYALRYYKSINGADTAYNNSLASPVAFTHTTDVYHWKFTMNEKADSFVRFYINGTYMERFLTELTSGTIGVMRFEEQNEDGEDLCAGPPQCYASAGGIFDNITVTPNDYYRNVQSIITSSTPAGAEVDTTAPTLTIVAPSPSNSTRNSTTAAINATVTDDTAVDTVLIEFDGINYTAMQSGNNYNRTFTSLADGSHNYKVYANDSSGNANVSATTFFTVHTMPPSFNFLAPTPADASYLTTTTAVINVTIDSGFDSDIAILVFDSVSTTMNRTNLRNYSSIQSGLAQGLHTWNIIANDTSGNVNISLVRTFTVDSLAPVIIITSPNATFTNSTIPINFNIGDANPDTTACFYNINGGTNITIIGCANTSITITGNENYTINIFVTDLAGNSASSSVTFEVNIPAAPAAPITGGVTFGFAVLSLIWVLQLLIILIAVLACYYMLMNPREPITLEKIIAAVTVILIAIMIAIVIGAFMSL